VGLRAKELIHLRWQDRSDRRHAAVDWRAGRPKLSVERATPKPKVDDDG
jgi:hypothetical protein